MFPAFLQHVFFPSCKFTHETKSHNTQYVMYYIVILRWPVGSRMLHQNTTVIRRVTTVRTERGVRLTVCQGDVS